MKQYFYIFIGLVLLVASCKKEPIPELVENNGSEGIYFKGKLQSEEINLSSSGNYYMYSGFHFDTIRQVYIFTGELKERYCTNCGTSIRLSITNAKRSPQGIANLNYDSIFNNPLINWGSVTTDELGLAEIELIKGNGHAPMSSMHVYQVPTNKLKINSFELYKENEQGQPTIKVSYEGKVTLATPGGNELFTFEGSFAFAIPQ